MKRIMLLVACAALAAGAAVGEERNKAETDNRIRLLFATVETPDTRTDKMQEAVIMPEFKPTYSDAELQKLRGCQLEDARWRNRDDIAANNRNRAGMVMREYERRVALQKEIAEKAQGTPHGRNIVLARDWFIGAMGKYSGRFLLISRVDDQQAQTEKFYGGADALDVEKSTLFVKLVLNDPSQRTESIPTAGGNTLTRTTTGQLITVQVQNLKNEVVFTENVEVSDVSGGSSVVRTAGEDDVLGKVLRKGLDRVADRIAETFTEEPTGKVKKAALKEVK
jgi:hypothetical protein